MDDRERRQAMAIALMGPVHAHEHLRVRDRAGIHERIPVAGRGNVRVLGWADPSRHGAERGGKQSVRPRSVQVKDPFWARVYFSLVPVAAVGCSIAVGLIIAMVAR